MTAVRTKHARMITRLALVLALAVAASMTLAGFAERLQGGDHGQDTQVVPPEVVSHMDLVLGGRSSGDLFPQHR
jgi:hypothetical protein